MDSCRLIIVIRQFWPHSGPAQLAAIDLAEEFQRNGHSVEIVTARMEKNWPANFDLREIPITRVSKPTIGPWSAFRYQRSLGQYLTSIPEPDGVIVFGLDDEVHTVARAFGPSVPLVVRADYRITPYRQLTTKLSRKNKSSLRMVRKVIADSVLSRRMLISYGLPEALVVAQDDHVCTELDNERTNSTRASARRSLTDAHPVLAIDPDHVMAVTGAPVDEDGGVEDLVRAWPRVLRTIPNAKLWILGEGPTTHKLWETIKSLELVYSVILPGFFDEPSEIFSAADLYIHPLRTGRACRFLTQAMSEGLCSVVTSTEFTQQLTQPNENSIVITSNNPDAIAEAVIHAAEDESLRTRLATAAQRSIALNRPIKRATNQYLDWLGLTSLEAETTTENQFSTTD